MPDEIVIREAQPQDVAEIVRHRRRMYEDMGERDAAALDAMQASTAVFLEKAIPRGVFAALSHTRYSGPRLSSSISMKNGSVIEYSDPPKCVPT
jgi:hypothetical protein